MDNNTNGARSYRSLTLTLSLLLLLPLLLLWPPPVSCSTPPGDEESTSIVATLQIPNAIFNTTPYPNALSGFVATSTANSELFTSFQISCESGEFSLCQSITGHGSWLEFTAITGSTTYDLPGSGVIVCGGTNSSGTAICNTWVPDSLGLQLTESNVYPVYFSTMDEDLAFSLDATTMLYNLAPVASTAAPSAAATTTASSTLTPSATSSAATSTSITTSAPSTTATFSPFAASTAQPTQTARSHDLTEHEKIGVGVGIVAFVLVCCAAGLFFLKSYRQKRRTANPNPSELYFNTDEKGQSSGT